MHCLENKKNGSGLFNWATYWPDTKYRFFEAQLHSFKKKFTSERYSDCSGIRESNFVVRLSLAIFLHVEFQLYSLRIYYFNGVFALLGLLKYAGS